MILSSLFFVNDDGASNSPLEEVTFPPRGIPHSLGNTALYDAIKNSQQCLHPEDCQENNLTVIFQISTVHQSTLRHIVIQRVVKLCS